MASHNRTRAGGRRADCSAPLADISEGFIARLRRSARMLMRLFVDGHPLPAIPPRLSRRCAGEYQGKGENGVDLGIEHNVLLVTSNVLGTSQENGPGASCAPTYDFVEGPAPVTRKCSFPARGRWRRSNDAELGPRRTAPPGGRPVRLSVGEKIENGFVSSLRRQPRLRKRRGKPTTCTRGPGLVARSRAGARLRLDQIAGARE
jgi:hypothetical protein